MSVLEKIQTQIGEAEKRHAEVKKELTTLRALYEEKRREQGATIVDDKNAEKLGKEVVFIKSQIEGAEEAKSQLLDILRDLQGQKSAELRFIARGRAQKEKMEIRLIEVDIYEALVQAAKRLPDLRRKRGDYVRELQAAGQSAPDIRGESDKISFLFEALRREIPSLLEYFPSSIIADSDLPSSSAIRSLIRND